MVCLLHKQFIKSAYNTRGNELCKFVRAEVMERVEDKSAEDILTEEEYNEIVRVSMNRVKNIIAPLIDVEVENIINLHR